MPRERRDRNLEPLTPDAELSHAANYLYMLTGSVPDAAACKALGVTMNLYAEHELNVSTYTARLVIDARSDFYSAMVAALGALKGPLSGGSPDEVMRMLTSIGTPERISAYVEQELAVTARIPGFGHRLYSTGDPRAMHLKHAFDTLTHGRGQWFLLSEALERCVEQRTGRYPNVDFYAAPVLYQLGFPPELFTNVVASARVAGWAAHVLEQHGEERIKRARADYVGPRVGQ